MWSHLFKAFCIFNPALNQLCNSTKTFRYCSWRSTNFQVQANPLGKDIFGNENTNVVVLVTWIVNSGKILEIFTIIKLIYNLIKTCCCCLLFKLNNITLRLRIQTGSMKKIKSNSDLNNSGSISIWFVTISGRHFVKLSFAISAWKSFLYHN